MTRQKYGQKQSLREVKAGTKQKNKICLRASVPIYNRQKRGRRKGDQLMQLSRSWHANSVRRVAEKPWVQHNKQRISRAMDPMEVRNKANSKPRVVQQAFRARRRDWQIGYPHEREMRKLCPYKALEYVVSIYSSERFSSKHTLSYRSSVAELKHSE